MISKVNVLRGGFLLAGIVLFTFSRVTVVVAGPCLADINQDGSVNGGDMMILTEEMGRDDCFVTPCQADLNSDGNVDGEDESILRSEFGRYDCLPGNKSIFDEKIYELQPTQDVQFEESDMIPEEEIIISDEVDEIKSSEAEPSAQTSRFIDNGNGTVTDPKTGLMWTKDANLPGDTLLFHQALTFIDEMNEGKYPNFGFNDWRLPTLDELRSLIDYTKFTSKGRVLPLHHPFESLQSLSLYRQSVTYLSATDHPWFVALYCRLVGHNITFCYGFVWPVRGGKGDQL
jgi:hypothetical protein